MPRPPPGAFEAARERAATKASFVGDRGLRRRSSRRDTARKHCTQHPRQLASRVAGAAVQPRRACGCGAWARRKQGLSGTFRKRLGHARPARRALPRTRPRPANAATRRHETYTPSCTSALASCFAVTLPFSRFSRHPGTLDSMMHSLGSSRRLGGTKVAAHRPVRVVGARRSTVSVRAEKVRATRRSAAFGREFAACAPCERAPRARALDAFTHALRMCLRPGVARRWSASTSAPPTRPSRRWKVAGPRS